MTSDESVVLLDSLGYMCVFLYLILLAAAALHNLVASRQLAARPAG
jgi:hypothetical protein